MDAKLCAWWAHRQGLDGRLAGMDAAAVLARTGWARSVGGAAPYLTLFARSGLGRAAVDLAVAAVAIHELPSARRCTYVLPAADFALGLQAGESFGEAEMKLARKLGVTDSEVAYLCDAVVKALGRESLDPNAIRKKVGDAARSLGPEGVRKGITTTLPLALGLLQTEGRIRRVSVNGRLDQQRYKYCVWKPNPRQGWKTPAAEGFTELARHYFQWIGPASLQEFQWFSGLGVGAAKAAVAPLDLVEFENRLLPSELEEGWRKFKAPSKPQYALVSSIDGISLLRRDLAGIIDGAEAERAGIVLKGSVEEIKGHLILDRGRVIGRWEYDTETETIAWHTWVPRHEGLLAAVGRMESFVRDELGDARGFSLDSPKSRAPRIQALREAGSR